MDIVEKAPQTNAIASRVSKVEYRVHGYFSRIINTRLPRYYWVYYSTTRILNQSGILETPIASCSSIKITWYLGDTLLWALAYAITRDSFCLSFWMMTAPSPNLTSVASTFHNDFSRSIASTVKNPCTSLSVIAPFKSRKAFICSTFPKYFLWYWYLRIDT